MIRLIELAQTGDIEKVLHVINISNRAFTKVVPSTLHEGMEIPFQSFKEFFEDASVTFFVYKTAGKIIGTAALRILSETKGRLRMVGVLPEYQRKGIGTTLVKHIEDVAIQKGLQTIDLFTLKKATWAVSFYQKMDYKIVSSDSSPWGPDVFMEKELSP